MKSNSDFNFPYYHGVDIWSVATITTAILMLLIFVIASVYSIRKREKVFKISPYFAKPKFITHF